MQFLERNERERAFMSATRESAIKCLLDILEQKPSKDAKQAEQMINEAKEYILAIRKPQKLEEKKQSTYGKLSQNLDKRIKLDNGLDTEVNCFGYNTLLTKGIKNGHTEIVRYLLDQKADPNLRTVWGETPLNIASRNGSTKIVKHLLEHKADPDLPNQEGSIPLIAAIEKGGFDAYNALGRSMEAPLKNFIEMAKQKNSFEGYKDLLESFNKLDVATFPKNSFEIVNLLIKAGANLELEIKGETALDHAVNHKLLDHVKILLEHGAVIRNSEKLETFLIRKYDDFCFGVLREHQEEYEEAKKFYERAIMVDPSPAAYRRLGAIYERERNIPHAAALYKKAVECGDDVLSLNRLVTILHESLTHPMEQKESAIASETPSESVLSSPIHDPQIKQQESKEENAESVTYETLTASIYSFLISQGLHADLSVDQWIFLATDALANDYFKYYSIQGIHLALRLAQKAEEKAEQKVRETAEKAEKAAQKTVEKAQKEKAAQAIEIVAKMLQHQLTQPLLVQMDHKADHQQPLDVFLVEEKEVKKEAKEEKQALDELAEAKKSKEEATQTAKTVGKILKQKTHSLPVETVWKMLKRAAHSLDNHKDQKGLDVLAERKVEVSSIVLPPLKRSKSQSSLFNKPHTQLEVVLSGVALPPLKRKNQGLGS